MKKIQMLGAHSIISTIQENAQEHGGVEDQMVGLLERSQKFNIGEYNSLPNISSDNILDLLPIRLPYKITYIEGIACDNRGKFKASILCDELSETIEIFEFFREGKQWLILPVWYVVNKKMEEKTRIFKINDGVSVKEKEIPILHRRGNSCAGFLFQFLSILNCNNIITKKNNVSEKINQKRITKNKHPFFSYYTLHVKPKLRYGKNNGKKNDRNSPRIHLRRGHIRRLPTSKTTWVQACIVGNQKNGIIMKDYVIHANG